jgi:acetylornithine deacetylase/succinyl-diaminopimelate desuccinylase-like protein
MAAVPDLYTDLAQTIPAVREEFESFLSELVQIPTISMDPAHAADIQRGAHTAAAILQRCGATATIIDTPGNPVVFGQFAVNPAYPTVALYNHLDVQPANEPQWQYDPFVFQREGDRYLGRGTTDDKGPALTALLAARFAVRHGLPLNMQFIWELEEEIGSPHFAHFVEHHRDLLTCNSVLVSDTVWLSRTTPAIPYGLRGMLTMTLKLTTGSKDCHSGLTGGAARNPVGELADLIARCYDARTGRVSIPGFYEDVRPLSKAELDNFLSSGFDLQTFMDVHGLHTLRSNNVRQVVQAIWSEPTFEVHGISGGYQGPGIKTIVPHTAEAKISMRLVPDQDPERLLPLVQDFLRRQHPDVEVLPGGFLRPYLGDFAGFYGDAVREAVRFGFGQTPSFIREGGSIGAVVTLDQLLQVPVVFLGLSLPEHGYHAPNEYFDWGQASGGMRAFVKYFDLLAQA